MVGDGLLEAGDDRAQLGKTQPVRHRTPKDAALLEKTGPFRSRRALAGDDEHDAVSTSLGADQERPERVVCLGLTHAVEVDHGIDGVGAPRQALAQAALQRDDRRQGGRRRLCRRRGGADGIGRATAIHTGVP